MCNAKSIISALGGPSHVAKTYGFKPQRVCNWGKRGIPDSILLDHPEFSSALFLAGYVREKRTP